MAGVLDGIRIVEWAVHHAGPGGSAILGEMGAEVIKIERPDVGDSERATSSFGNIDLRLPGNRNVLFEASNRNKKSITLDLTKEEGREVLFRLVAKSDVFYTNFRKQTCSRMGVNYSTLSRYNPRLIYAVVSGSGYEGPDSEQRMMDPQAQARSGMMYAMGEPDMPPLLLRLACVDQATAFMGSFEIIAALLARERMGVGQEVHVSLLSAAMCLTYVDLLMALLMKKNMPKFERAEPENPMYNYYQCADGRWLFCVLYPFERHWGDFCKALGVEELENDPRFDTHEKRVKNVRQAVSIIDRVFATKSRDEWLRIAKECGDLPFTPVNSFCDLVNDPQVIANNYVVDFDHPSLGRVKYPGFPIHFSKTPAGVTSAAPELGQHTEEVLNEIAGYSWEEINKLRDEGII